MTTTIQVQREITKIKQVVKPKLKRKIALVWDHGDDHYGCDGYSFKSKRALQEYLDEQGYGRSIVMGWHHE